jgi:hypothetical protein
MALLGQDQVKCKIIVDDKCLQQVQNFKYLDCEISYKNGNYIQQKLAKFAQTLGIINSNFKQTLDQKFSKIKKIYI